MVLEWIRAVATPVVGGPLVRGAALPWTVGRLSDITGFTSQASHGLLGLEIGAEVSRTVCGTDLGLGTARTLE